MLVRTLASKRIRGAFKDISRKKKNVLSYLRELGRTTYSPLSAASDGRVSVKPRANKSLRHYKFTISCAKIRNVRGLFTVLPTSPYRLSLSGSLVVNLIGALCDEYPIIEANSPSSQHWTEDQLVCGRQLLQRLHKVRIFVSPSGASNSTAPSDVPASHCYELGSRCKKWK